MLNENSLIEQVNNFLNSIQQRKPVRLINLDNTDKVALIRHLLPHKLEYLSFLSINETSSIDGFYLDTWKRQFEVLLSSLSDALVSCGAIFLQGFPRVVDYERILSPGMRSDIDIFIPNNKLNDFYNLSRAQGFLNYGFSEKDIFILDRDTIKDFTAESWADKDFTLTLPLKCDLPKNLPLDFDDCYLPWLLRNNQWNLMVAIEIHHSYTDISDVLVINDNHEDWLGTPFKRCNFPSLIYFNIVRLYNGVFAGEKRLRLLLDTACLFTDPKLVPSLPKLKKLISESACSHQLYAVCESIINLHDIFKPLNYIFDDFRASELANKWSVKFFDSLRLHS